jgi:hypothetical protein
MDLWEIAGMLNLIQYRNDDTLFLEMPLICSFMTKTTNIFYSRRYHWAELHKVFSLCCIILQSFEHDWALPCAIDYALSELIES